MFGSLHFQPGGNLHVSLYCITCGCYFLHSLRGISLCELSKAFFYLLQRLSCFHWIRQPFTAGTGGLGGGVGGVDCWSFAFSTHCLVNEPESGYCHLSSSGLDSAVPCLIDISFPSIPTQTPRTSFHIQPYYQTLISLSMAWARPDEYTFNAHTYLSPLSLSALLLFIKEAGEQSWEFRLRLDLQEIPLNKTFNLVFRLKSVNSVETGERKCKVPFFCPLVASTSQLIYYLLKFF